MLCASIVPAGTDGDERAEGLPGSRLGLKSNTLTPKTCFPISSMHPFVGRYDKRICSAENSESVKIGVRLRG